MKFTAKRYDQLVVGDVFVRSTTSHGVLVIVDSVKPDPEKERLLITGHNAHGGEAITSRYKCSVMVNVVEDDPKSQGPNRTGSL